MIVMLSGKQGAGKTTLTKLLAKNSAQFGKCAGLSLKFADPMYDMHDEIQGVFAQYGLKTEAKDGRLLQMIGDYGREKYGPMVWIDIMRNRIDASWKNHILIVIDDCRFVNEFEAFPEAFRVRLSAPESVRRPRAHSWREGVHKSEVDLDQYEAEKRFDLHLNTSIAKPEWCMEEIIRQVNQGIWRDVRDEKRD